MFFFVVYFKLYSFVVREQFSSIRYQFVKTFSYKKTEFGQLKHGAELIEG